MTDDFLTESIKPDPSSAESRWLEAAQAVARLQEASATNGTDQLSDSEIEEEIAESRWGA